MQDSSGNGFGATKAGGVTCAKGHNGWGLSFDGSTGALNIPDNAAFHYTNSLTIDPTTAPNFSCDDLVAMQRRMLLIRGFEDRVAALCP